MDLSISPQNILEALLHTKESLIDFGLKKRSTLMASSFSILNTCAQLLRIYGEDFDDSFRIKATSELSRERPSMQSKLENRYADRKGEQSEVNCGSLTSDNVPDIPSPPSPPIMRVNKQKTSHVNLSYAMGWATTC